MTDDHITLRISKKSLLLVLVLVLVPSAFVAGLTVGGESSPETATTSTTTATTSTTLSPTTSTSVIVGAQSSPPTTAKKKKVVAATTTAPPEALDVVATYSDDCPPSLPANARVPGKMTITWKSTSAVRALVEVIHGADLDYEENNHKPNDTLVLDRLCNNVREANGSYLGRPLTVIYRITVYGADGKTAQDGGNDSM